jgi:3-deoxy-D-manno-octulosonic-acid transferase
VLSCYNLLWKLARPFLRRHKRLGEDFSRRLLPSDWPGLADPGGASPPYRLWLHAASGGEAYLALELLRKLSGEGAPSERRILCTSCTRQGLEILRQARREETRSKKYGPGVDYLPLDEPDLMDRAVYRVFGANKGEPRVLGLLETEIWPGLLWACRKHGVSVLVLNGRMSAASLRGYRLLRAGLRRCAPAEILAVSREDLERFRALFGGGEGDFEEPRRYSLMPNIKFDRIRPAAGGPDEEGLFPRPLLALASVREEEEALLLPLISRLLSAAPQCCLVLAPRHLHRLEAWEKHLAGLKLDYTRRSAGLSPGPGRVLLWDSFGELDLLYRLASAVFVGGSLAPLGGQNFLEPMSQGLVPCIGPFWDNFAWAGKEIFELGLARQARDAGELGSLLLEQLENPPPREEVKTRLAAYLRPRQGGTLRAAESLERALRSG